MAIIGGVAACEILLFWYGPPKRTNVPTVPRVHRYMIYKQSREWHYFGRHSSKNPWPRLFDVAPPLTWDRSSRSLLPVQSSFTCQRTPWQHKERYKLAFSAEARQYDQYPKSSQGVESRLLFTDPQHSYCIDRVRSILSGTPPRCPPQTSKRPRCTPCSCEP